MRIPHAQHLDDAYGGPQADLCAQNFDDHYGDPPHLGGAPETELRVEVFSPTFRRQTSGTLQYIQG